MNNELIENIAKIHTTEMGVDRIRRNLSLGDTDVVKWCYSRILDEGSKTLMYVFKTQCLYEFMCF